MRGIGIALLLALAATTARADDDPLDEARRLEASLDYNAALIIVDRTIAQGGATRDQLVTLHMFAGKLAAGLDRTEVAEDHFARVLALAPTATFPEGTSPKITGPFDAARARSVPLRVTTAIERGAVSIIPAADPLGLVVGIAVKLDTGNELREPHALRVSVPGNAHAIEISALDAYGNRVWAELVTATSPPIDATTTTLRPLVARWPFWTATSAIALVGAGVCAWRFDVAQNEWDRGKANGLPFTELQSIEDRGRRWGLAANIGFGVAAASAVVAIVTAARGSTTTRESTTTAFVTAQHDSIGLAIIGGF